MAQKDTGTPMFTAAMFIVAKIWRQHKCPSTEDTFNYEGKTKNDLYLHDIKCVEEKWTDQLMNKVFPHSLDIEMFLKLTSQLLDNFSRKKLFWYDISIALRKKNEKIRECIKKNWSLMKIIRGKKRKLKWLNNGKITSVNSV